MGSELIVVPAPGLAAGPRMIERVELIHVQALVAKAPVEALDVPVVGRFARAREVELDPAAPGPVLQGSRGELGAVVAGDRPGCAMDGDPALEHLGHRLAGEAAARLQ